MTDADLVKAVRRAAKRRQRAERLKREALADLRDSCLRAQGAGVPVTEIAREAGLSRQGLYKLLDARRSS
jgi:DNA-binding phage protein